jgi:multidrug resistance efflux pump
MTQEKNSYSPTNGDVIRTPLPRHMQIFARRLLPVIVWGIAIAILLVLARGQIRTIDAVGVVEEREVTIVPLVDGVIRTVAVQPLDVVREDDVVVMLDDTEVQARTRVAQARLSQLRAQLQADTAKEQRTNQDDLRRFELNEETARLDLMDRVVTQESDRITLTRLGVLMQRQERLAEEKVGVPEEYDNIRLEHAALAKKIEENDKAIAQAKQSLADAQRRKENRVKDAGGDASADTLFPLQEAIKVQEAQIAELNERARNLVLRAPMAGTVSRLVMKPGQTVMKGQELLAVTDPNATQVVAWIDESIAYGVRNDMDVELLTRRYPRDVVRAKVTKVGMKIDRFPFRLRPNPNLPGYGLSFLVGGFPAGKFYPGEVLDVRFLQKRI